MVYNIKGEVSIGKGLGLPQMTTAERLAYSPPVSGFLVYDTDLGASSAWNGAAWVDIADVKDRVFLSDTLVAPASAGSPTVGEITTAASSTVDAILYYTGTDTSSGAPTHVYQIDGS